ncbi:hypothetical protein NPIRD3C_2085 [Nitrosopumilus piranensis]|uniref:Uncharacterized protein n=1 Tax=Nitrosopumilus piranensis TaxID=1582439 RepID=A0A0C5C1P0_9ARCH|nr:hypothetical protein NPIRD3C_2085 [Nitrosopumilus piranensis]
METCPKCSNEIRTSATNVTILANQPWRKIQAKFCTDCDFVELFHN